MNQASHRSQARRGILSRVLGWIFGYHEAGQPFSPKRSTLPDSWSGPQDSRYDDPPEERRRVLHKARYFEANNGIVNRLADVFEQFTIGRGLTIIPKSSNPKWNKAAKRRLKEVTREIDLDSRQSFESFQGMVARRWFVDGETFILKTKAKVNGRELPKLQCIEAHRVCTPSHLSDREGKDIFDGIQHEVIGGRVGRPIVYWVEEGDQHVPRSAESIIHVCEPSRPGQRAFSFFDSTLNVLHDLDDLQMLEMEVAKDAAEKANVIQTESGQMSAETLRKARFNLSTQDTQGNETLESRIEHYKKVLGARTVALRIGEKLEQFKSDRPNVTTREYWDYLTALVCAGTGISKLLVFPHSKIQGTVVRADLDIQNTWFRTRGGILSDAFYDVTLWLIGWESNFDLKLANKPGDWQEWKVLGPRGCNVDIGRNSAAMLAELDAGATTFEKIYADLGEDYEEQLTQRASEEAFIDSLAKQFNLTPARIRKAATEALELQMQEEAQRRAEEEEEEIEDDEESAPPPRKLKKAA